MKDMELNKTLLINHNLNLLHLYMYLD